MSIIQDVLSGQISFSFPEILSLFGCAQCVYILVYLAFRSGRIARGTIPILFFLFLGVAFTLDLAASAWAPIIPFYAHLQWFFWFSLAPLSTLLILQIVNITHAPPWAYFLLSFIAPVGYLMTFLFFRLTPECADIFSCTQMQDGLIIVGILISALSLLTIWLKKDSLGNLFAHNHGKERYWLVISIIILNISLMIIFMGVSYGLVALNAAYFIRTCVGFAFVYLAATSLFRIYPQAVSIRPKDKNEAAFLTDSEIEAALKVERLLNIEKVYQEPSYGRSDLAREVGVSESILSKIVNVHFEKSVPQLLNAYRVEDAKVLLIETDADLATISEEAGFNSVTTFNRYFKDLTGYPPSEFRQKNLRD